MTFTVEVLLKGEEDVVSQAIDQPIGDPQHWTDAEVRDVLSRALLEFDRVQSPGDDADRHVTLQGFSWIVTPVTQGVVIAIEIPSGAVVAGPFDVEVDWLTQAITRVLADRSGSAGRVH